MNQGNGLHPAIRDHYADMNAALHNRDALIEQVNVLQNALTVANGKAAFLEKQLEKMTQERDYYFRKSFAYTNTLTSARNQISAMLTLADHEGENPGPAQLTQHSEENACELDKGA